MIEDELTPEFILHAYRFGAFPMAEHAGVDAPIHFYQPEERAVFTTESFHIPRRVSRWLKQELAHNNWSIRYPHDVHAIMVACAENRDESWINLTLLEHYTILAKTQYVQAIGVYDQGTLIGGLYWVQIGAAVMAESMFSRVSGASKFALVSFMAALHNRQKRVATAPTWVDVQFINEHLAQFHPILWDGETYQSVLDFALSLSESSEADSVLESSFLASDFGAESLAAFLQFKTQIS
jgi:leucyl/phenylalanyl-tRNA--protein transferase